MTVSRSVLITGAGGFVCGSITRVLLERGWQIIAVDRQFNEISQQSLQSGWGDRIRFVKTDSLRLPDMSVDALIHGAAVTALPEDLGQSAEDNFRTNVEPLLAVSEWANEHKVKRALFISSSAVYTATNPGAVTETMPTSPVGLYAVAKQTIESFVTTLRELHGRDVAAIRLSNIYGLDEQARHTRPRISLVGQMVQQALQTGKITVYRNDPARDWTFATDIGVAVDSLLSQSILHFSLYNVASEQVLSPVDIAETIHALMPNVILDVRSGINPNSPKLTRLGYLSHRRLQDETGFTAWTSFKEGLQQVIASQTEKEIHL